MSGKSDAVTAVDLFCGAGGLSTGLALACEHLDRDVDLAAVNHWDIAVETHEANHPWADHYRAGVEELTPREVVPEGDIDLLIAAPECTHFSKARGGKPVNPQKRMAPFHVLDWVAQLRPESVLIENVPDFESWGPVVDGSATKNGTFFEAWTDTLRDGLGYSVSHRKLMAADYGDPTSRERLFVIARRDDSPVWPTPTHAEDAGEDDEREPWRSAAEIIDWTDLGDSIWTRDLDNNRIHNPLKNSTMQRVAEGVRRHCHDDLDPFAEALADIGRDDVFDLREDVVAAEDAEGEAEKRDDPFLVEGTVPEVSADGGAGAFLLGQHGGAVARDVDEPTPTVATRGAIGLYHPEAFILPRNGVHRGLHSNAPYLPDERPFHTVTASNHDGFLVTPFLVEYYGNGGSQSVDDPLPTVTTRDRFALVLPEFYPWGLDVRFRMLQPPELARAQGFPDDYEFRGGTKKAVTKQIGNAVPVNLATALCRQLLEQGGPTLDSFAATEGVSAGD